MGVVVGVAAGIPMWGHSHVGVVVGLAAGIIGVAIDIATDIATIALEFHQT
jgi:hypothetical protein